MSEPMADDSVVSPDPVGTEPDSVGITDAGVAEGPYFEFDYGNGDKFTAANKGELADHFRHSSMRKSDLDTEMAKVSKRSAYLEEKITAAEAKESVANQLAGLYSPMDSLMKSNSSFNRYVQEAYDSLTKGGGKAPDVREVVKEALAESLKPYDEKFSGLEKAEKERATKAATADVHSRLRAEKGDFDEEMLNSEFTKFQSIPTQDLEYAFRRLLLHSVRGRENPAELERRTAENAARRRAPSVTSTPGVKPTVLDPNKMSEEQRAQAAIAELDKLRR